MTNIHPGASQLTPEQQRIYDKIKHLPKESQLKVLALAKKMAPANNLEALKAKFEKDRRD